MEVAPWRLALVVVMQYLEGLTDRQAADAVRRCIDWKYALSLDLHDPGFDFTLLHDFRQRLLTHDAAQRLLDTFLTTCKARGWIKARGTQRTDSTYVLAEFAERPKPLCGVMHSSDFSVVLFRSDCMLGSEEPLMKTHKNQRFLTYLSLPLPRVPCSR